MIQRFEDEYPETKAAAHSSPTANGAASPDPSVADASILSGSIDSNGLAKVTSEEEYFPKQADSSGIKLLRTNSNTSLVSKAITDEEGRMHRFGQTMRREVLKPTGLDDNLHGTSRDDNPEPEHLAALRAKLEEIRGDDIRIRVEREGADKVIEELGVNAQELRALALEDPEGFEAFRNSQLAAQINSGRIGTEHDT